MRTRRCLECGAESTIFFGFTLGCRYNGGSHRHIEAVATTPEREAAKLAAAYASVPEFDRAAFERLASAEARGLLAEAQGRKAPAKRGGDRAMTETPYIDGYQAGYRGADGEGIGLSQDAEELLSIGKTDEQLSDYWLGYYHGRYQARTGQVPPGAQARARVN